MATYIAMRSGHVFRVSDSLTLEQVNDELNKSSDRFVAVPLHPDSSTSTTAGTPGAGQPLTGLYITPESVSHFYTV